MFTFEGIDQKQLIIYFGMAVFFIYFYFYYKKRIKEETRALEEGRISYLEHHSDLPDDIRGAILGGKVVKGMEEEDLYASLGYPKRKKILTVEPASSEVLIYPGLYVHMHMGVVQNWKYQKKLLGL